MKKVIVAKSLDQYIKEESKKDPTFRKAFAKEVTRLERNLTKRK